MTHHWRGSILGTWIFGWNARDATGYPCAVVYFFLPTVMLQANIWCTRYRVANDHWISQAPFLHGGSKGVFGSFFSGQYGCTCKRWEAVELLCLHSFCSTDSFLPKTPLEPLQRKEFSGCIEVHVCGLGVILNFSWQLDWVEYNSGGNRMSKFKSAECIGQGWFEILLQAQLPQNCTTQSLVTS